MKVSTIIKLNFLVLALGVTLYFIFNLKKGELNPALQSLLGVEQTQTAADGSDLRKWNWCDTRVTSMIQPDRFKIAQQGDKWVRENGAAHVVDFISVEKWLAKFCTVLVTPVKAVVDDAFAVAFLVKFVDGKVEIVRRHPQGTYFWNGQTFTSPAFDAALAELSQLPVK